ncbi:MAG: PEP-CTERM sorting domain-containing protein [Thiobacillaceae bacterium]
MRRIRLPRLGMVFCLACSLMLLTFVPRASANDGEGLEPQLVNGPPTPEPATGLLLVGGAVCLLRRRSRRTHPTA